MFGSNLNGGVAKCQTIHSTNVVLNFTRDTKNVMIVNISDTEFKSIKKKLPDLNKILKEDELYIEKGVYNKIFISVFDHWLTRNEADEMIFIDDDYKELISRREKFQRFVDELFQSTSIYFWKYKRNYRVFIKKPLTNNDLIRKCDFNNLYSQRGRHYSLILPEFSAIYNEEWDWTNILWYKDFEKIKPVLEIAKKVGLYILE